MDKDMDKDKDKDKDRITIRIIRGIRMYDHALCPSFPYCGPVHSVLISNSCILAREYKLLFVYPAKTSVYSLSWISSSQH